MIKVSIPDNANWGVGPRAMGTFITNANQDQYNFYIVAPSQHQVLKYPPSPDGSGYPQLGRINYLSVSQDVSTVDDMYVDGKVYLVDKGQITQYELGQVVHTWKPASTGDQLLRPNGPFYTRLTADNPAQDAGTFYAYDGLNRRIVAFTKSDGSIVGQYMVPANTPWFSALTGMFVIPGTGGSSPTLYWTEGGNLMSAYLNPSAAPSASASPGPSLIPLPTPSPTKKH